MCSTNPVAPAVPIENVYRPAFTSPGSKVSVLDPVVGFVPKTAVTPAGNPETASFTVPVNPYNGATATAAVEERPVPRFKLPGAEESEKLGV